ncbi:MAG: hypothetical protein GC185_04400 [Alphaproteobacteria bacterium]|nr:hypothetical protein [Alphaproteobacteria bacterium]
MKKTLHPTMPGTLPAAQLHVFKKALILSGVAFIAFSTPAQAGFQWKGPVAPPVAQQPAPMAAPMSAPDQSMSGLEPVTNWNGQTAAAPAAPMPPPDAAPAPMSAPMPASVPAPVETAPVPAVDASDVISGFGTDVPLVMALQQIVPPGYQYSFSSGVNPGLSVSWQGGKPWKTVLGETLEQQQLGYRVQNNVVVVGDFPPPAPPAPPAQAMPDAAPAPQVMPAPTKADQIPDDMVGGSASSAPAEQKPVDIRRQKPKSFWQRINPFDHDKDDSMGANEQPARTADMTATNSADTQAMNAARQQMAAPADGGDMTTPPASVVHPAVNSMADQAMAGATVSSMPPADNSNWGTPSAQMPTVSPAPSSATSSSLAAPASMAPAAMPESPSAADEQHAVDLTAPDSTADSASAGAKTVVASAQTSAPAAMVPASAGLEGEWTASKGATLRDVLKTWSDKAGVQLYWSIDYNYKINGDVDFNGSYGDAVGKLLDQFSAVRPQPYGQLHQSSDGPRVLVVKSYDIAQ